MDNQGFNPRTRVGCDRSNLSTPDTPMLFQSTHPRGVRRGEGREDLHLGTGFNPRTRVGCDGTPPGTAFRISCFNPRTRVGCDLYAD